MSVACRWLNQDGELSRHLTKGDITRGLLRALQRNYEVEEVRTYRASHLFEDIESDRSSLILRYNIKQARLSAWRFRIQQYQACPAASRANPQIARRIGIAVYEAEMNLIIHTTNGGTLRVEIEPHRISSKHG
jgi:hypothetical protein